MSQESKTEPIERKPSPTRDVELARGQDRLKGRVALVVGGGMKGLVHGTGSAMSILLAAQGASVAVLGRTAEHTNRTVDVITKARDEAFAVLGDASEEAVCERAVAETIDRYGRLDIVVNNLGTTVGPKIKTFDQETWDLAMRTNVTSIMFTTKYAYPHLAAQDTSSIINISSIAGMQTVTGDTPLGGVGYDTTKATIIALTRNLANELGPDGIRVNCIVPGHLATPTHVENNPDGHSHAELRKQLTMLRIEGTGWDVAWAALFLASDESRYITAIALLVDAGVTQKQAFTSFLRLHSIGL